MKYKQAEQHFTNIKRLLRRILLSTPKPEIEDDHYKKEIFAKLSSQDQLKIIEPQLKLYISAVQRKSEILPAIATLAATLIVVATLNRDLVPLRPQETKVILSAFLFLIPTTLNYFVKQMERTALNAINIIRSYYTDDPFNNLFEENTFLSQLSSDFPIIIVYIFYGVVFFILFRIWVG